MFKIGNEPSAIGLAGYDGFAGDVARIATCAGLITQLVCRPRILAALKYEATVRHRTKPWLKRVRVRI